MHCQYRDASHEPEVVILLGLMCNFFSSTVYLEYTVLRITVLRGLVPKAPNI